MMSKHSKKDGENAAGTLAAASLMQYFLDHDWKVISFFPNSPCALSKKCEKQSPDKQ